MSKETRGGTDCGVPGDCIECRITETQRQRQERRWASYVECIEMQDGRGDTDGLQIQLSEMLGRIELEGFFKEEHRRRLAGYLRWHADRAQEIIEGRHEGHIWEGRPALGGEE